MPIESHLQEKFLRVCEMTDAVLHGMTNDELARIRRLHLAIAKGPKIDASSIRIEDQILVLLDRSHHDHYPNFVNHACELVYLHSQELDWEDLTVWADRLNVEWAIPRLRDAVHTL